MEISHMNFPAASSGVSIKKIFISLAASFGELNPKRLNPFHFSGNRETKEK
jgi:hypothetical protein